MKNGGLIGSLLGSSLSLVRLIIINAYMRAGVKMKEGDDENCETEIFYREIKMKKVKCFCNEKPVSIDLTISIFHSF